LGGRAAHFLLRRDLFQALLARHFIDKVKADQDDGRNRQSEEEVAVVFHEDLYRKRK
jgi:hypothetical protein